MPATKKHRYRCRYNRRNRLEHPRGLLGASSNQAAQNTLLYLKSTVRRKKFAEF
jgi:hypothetical protein